METPHIKFNTEKVSAAPRRAAPGRNDKAFEKILRKDDDREEEQGGDKEQVKKSRSVKDKDAFQEVAENLAQPKQAESSKKASLFELAAVKKEEPEKLPAAQDDDGLLVDTFSEDVHKESLSALFKGYGSKERLQALQKEAYLKSSSADAALPFIRPEQIVPEAAIDKADAGSSKMMEPVSDLTGNEPHARPLAEEGYDPAKFAREQPDISGINPMAAAAGTSAAALSSVQGTAQPKTIAPQMQEIIDQIIDKLYTVSTQGRTDTVITLRHPPTFAGVNVVITSFESAKGEFNVAFENLTQAAKQILDQRAQQDSLRFALEQKGYTVHIITTTTITETLTLAQSSRPYEEGREEDARENEGRSGGEKEKEEE